jgi:hypothetical protein
VHGAADLFSRVAGWANARTGSAQQRYDIVVP